MSQQGRVATPDLQRRWGARPDSTYGIWLRDFYVSLETLRLVLRDECRESFAVFLKVYVGLLRLVWAGCEMLEFRSANRCAMPCQAANGRCVARTHICCEGVIENQESKKHTNPDAKRTIANHQRRGLASMHFFIILH
jgi:hypothetical protein